MHKVHRNFCDLNEIVLFSKFPFLFHILYVPVKEVRLGALLSLFFARALDVHILLQFFEPDHVGASYYPLP